ncbi:MAG: DUF2752 domain-containing protein [Candidatus Dormibacteraceae bacterium]
MATSRSETPRGRPSGGALAIVPAAALTTRRNLALLGGGAAWLVYTRFFFALSQAHATLPPCPFLYLTGHPCPFCGGTHGFAEMWHGDWRQALLDYPLAPVLFAGTLAAIPVLLIALVARRDLRLSPRAWKVALIVGGILLAVNWGLKLTVLPSTPR